MKRFDILLSDKDVAAIEEIYRNCRISVTNLMEILQRVNKQSKTVDVFWTYFTLHPNSRSDIDNILHYKAANKLNLSLFAEEMIKGNKPFIICFGARGGFITKVIEGKRKRYWKYKKLVSYKRTKFDTLEKM